MKKLLTVVIGSVLFITLIWLGLQLLSEGEENGAPPTQQQPVHSERRLSAADTDPFIGSRDALVTIILVSSFACPACKEAATIMDQVAALYPDDVRIVRKDLPESTGDSFRAAIAARCAQQQGRFWQYHDLLFAKQDIVATETLYRLWARDTGLIVPIFNTCLEEQETRHLIDANVAEALNLGITIVPYFQIQEDVGIEGPQPLAFFRRVIDGHLANANNP